MNTQEDKKQIKRNEFAKSNVIDKLKNRMYSRERKGFLPWRNRREIYKEPTLVNTDWDIGTNTQEQQTYPQGQTKRTYGNVGAFLIFSVVFFIIASIGSMLYLQSAVDTGSASAVDIVIEGSSAVSAGDVLELQVLVTNRNESALELADLVVTYPEGTVSPADFRTPLSAERIPLGRVEARSARRGAVRAVMLGTSGSRKNIKIELEYRIRGSNAIYSRSANHTTLITANAMSISIDANSQVTPGQSIPMSILVKSHSGTLLSDVYVDIALPFGFTIEDSAPAPIPDTTGTNVARWVLGTLRPGEERIVQISGKLDGQAGDRRTIVITAGAGASSQVVLNNAESAVSVLARNEHVIEVKKPFLAVSLEAGGVALNEYVAYSGTPFDVTVNWYNTLTVPINDATIAITLGGSALDKVSVNAGSYGFYRSVDSLLLWDSKTTPDNLKSIPPGASGTFTFTLTPLPQSFLEKIHTPKLTFKVHAAGKRLSEQGVPEILREDSFSEVKIGTDASFNAYGLFKSSPFGPLGPFPPRVEYETTYGIVWEITNTTSDLNEAVVRAELPHYVRWAGLTTPANEQVFYNKAQNTIEWHIGTVKAGTGVQTPPRTVSFAVGLVPSATQIGQTPDLVRNQVFEAIDTYTNKEISIRFDNIDTQIKRDEGYEDKNARVIR